MKQISITVLLSILISGLILVVTGIILAISSYSNYKNTSQLLTELAKQTVLSLERDAKTFVSPALDIAKFAIMAAENGTLDPSDRLSAQFFLSNSPAGIPQVAIVALWRPDGSLMESIQRKGQLPYISRDNSGDNADFMEHLSEIKKSNSARWSLPTREEGVSIITVFAPLRHEGRFLGVIGVGLSIDRFSDFMSTQNDKTETTSFVLFGKDHVLAHPKVPGISSRLTDDENPLIRVDLLGDKVISNLVSGGILSDARSDDFTIQNINTKTESYYALTRKISDFGEIPWYIGAYVPKKKLNQIVFRLIMTLAFSLALMLLSILAVIYISHRITSPIKKISQAALLVRDMRLDEIQKIPNSMITEVNAQAMAFNKMLEGLRWFSAYVPHQLVRQLIHGKSGDLPLSRKETVTVMFTDIVGFTELSEGMEPSEVADMLNRQFELINKAVEATGGTLDKYIGDAAMAFWGAPEAQQDHAVRACSAALKIADAIAKSGEGLRMKIALHTGTLIVGNIGAKKRMNYTVVGDTVNTCSRIENLAGNFIRSDSAVILISEQTASQVDSRFEVESLGEFPVKGRKNPVIVYQLLGEISKNS